MNFTMKLSNSVFVLFVVVLVSCVGYQEFDPKKQNFPLIRTLPVSNNDNTGVQFNGEVIKEGADPVLDHGFIWARKKSSSSDPTADTFLTSLGSDLKKEFSIRVSRKLIMIREYQVKAYVVTARDTVYGNAVKFTSKLTSPTLIDSFSPGSVLDGDILTIFGENFNEVAADDVTIGGNPAAVVSYGQKYVKVIVPAIAQAGLTNVVVDAFFAQASSNSLMVLSPSITSFSPTHGPIGQLVTLSGRFSSDINNNKVYFNGVGAYVSACTKNSISVYVPAGTSGDVTLSINVNGKSFTTMDLFLVE